MFSKDAYSTKYHSYFSRANNRRNLTGFVYQKATNSKPFNSLKRRALAKTKHGTANNVSTYLRIFIVKNIVWQISHRQTPHLFLVTFDIAVWRTWCLYVFHIRLHSEDNQITFRMKNPMTKYEVIRSMNSLNKLSTSKEFRKEFYAIYVFSGLDRYGLGNWPRTARWDCSANESLDATRTNRNFLHFNIINRGHSGLTALLT